ncbi:MAG: AarF/ABC1/UbiB kinase family protein [Kofleriaceae bacterium]|nr:MAG: AarF/ABC1/UbiB kinase family protein [Kofleriaceae bacterium]
MRGLLRWPGNVVHFLHLFLVLVLGGVAYLFGRLGTLLIFPGARRARAVGRLRGWLLVQGMTSLGATFIKMGQVMSTRPDLFSPEVIARLRHLQDRLPPFSFAKVKRVVEAELGKPITELYADFDEQPVAAASVAQVHRARLPDGREVAVKVLRPDVRRQVERDAGILLFGAKVLALHPRARLSDPVGHLRHFVDAIHDQTDLRIEAGNYRRFHANFAGASWKGRVAFPEVIESRCGQRVLTMEFVRGTKVDALPPGRHSKVAESVRLAMFKMCFDDGFLHADLHPGNMFVTDDDRLVIIDVGLCKLLHEDVLIQFIDMTKCLAMGKPDDLVDHLKRFHVYLDGVDWDSLRKDVDEFATRFRAQDIGQLDYSVLINDMFALGRRYNVRPVTDMTLVFVGMVTAQGIGKQLEPDVNVFNELARYLMPVLARRNERIPDTEQARAALGSA